MISKRSAYSTGFPVSLFALVGQRMGPQQRKHPDAYRHYASGWNAVRNRAIGCEECARSYSNLFLKHGVAPPQDVRIAQDNALFGFFAYSLSAIDSWFLAMYAVASMLKPSGFPIKTDKDLRGINPTSSSQHFARTFPQSSISTAMGDVLSEASYSEWKSLRNVLMHRANPSRQFYWPPRTTPTDADWIGMGIELDQNTLAHRYPLFTSILQKLLRATDQFTAQHF